MQITSINQLLRQIYPNIDNELIENLQIDKDITSTIINMKSDSINDTQIIDTATNTAVMAAVLNVEPTDENLLYLQRLGFSIGLNMKRLLKLVSEENSEHLQKIIEELSMQPEEIKNFLMEFSENDLIGVADKLDKLLALLRQSAGEYVDLSTKLSTKIYTDESIQEHIESIISFLLENQMDITSENIELVDKFMFVFDNETSDIMWAIDVLHHSESTIDIKKLIKDPQEFLKIYRHIHSYEQLMDTIDRQDIQHIAEVFIGQIERYTKLFPLEERKEIINFLKTKSIESYFLSQIASDMEEDLKQELMDLFESKIKLMEDSSVRAALYTRIESDIADTLQLQIKDNFPFWLVPIFLQNSNSHTFGELWVKKRNSKNEEKEMPYGLFLWSDFDCLGRIEMFIYGLDKNIDVYLLPQSDTTNLIMDSRDRMINILENYGLTVNSFQLLNPKDKSSLFSHILVTSTGTNKSLDIKI